MFNFESFNQVSCRATALNSVAKIRRNIVINNKTLVFLCEIKNN